MKILVEPGAGTWPYGIGVDRDDDDEWFLYALSPCCKSPMTYDGRPLCNGCRNKATTGGNYYSDTSRSLSAPNLAGWVGAWMGWGFDPHTDKVEVAITWKLV